MRYIYGPVRSRRLGLSLGVSLSPYKVCNFDCIYCQLGKTKELINQRSEYAKIDEVINELKSWFVNNTENAKGLNYITISGLGEPTLNIKIQDAIKEIRKITGLNIAVITNASLLNNMEVRQALLEADLIIPSLDTVSPEIFIKLKQPHPDVKIGDIINGLINLRKEFKG
ncbi:MAG: radical SAM protein, partial [Candidatus Omnitrophota bacterium]|nr:radical SAM protein [Candidatus Omnitrophota bacterium]